MHPAVLLFAGLPAAAQLFTLNQELTPTDPSVPVRSCGFSADGGLLAAGSAGGDVTLYSVDPTTHRAASLSTFLVDTNAGAKFVGGVVFSRQMSRGSSLLATTSNDHKLALYQVGGDGAATRCYSDKQGTTGYDGPATFSPYGGVLASATGNGEVHGWQTNTAACASSRPIGSIGQQRNSAWPFTCADFSSGGRLAAGGAVGKVGLYHMDSTGDFIHESDITVNDQPINILSPISVRFSPSGELLAVGDVNGTVFLYCFDGEGSTATLCHTMSDAADQARTLAFSPSGDVLAVGSFDKKVRLYSITKVAGDVSVTRRDVFSDSTDHIWSVAFSPRGDLLASASGDGKLRMYLRYPSPSPPPPGMYKCNSSTGLCEAAGGGVDKASCEAICNNGQKYQCVAKQCVESDRGIAIDLCQRACA